MAEPSQPNLLTKVEDKLKGMDTYIEGKMKRYSLMFSVNGGAFLIAKLFADPKNQQTLGGLSLRALAIGAIFFTILMWWDILLFGYMMKDKFFGGQLVFTPGGQWILHALCTLVIMGWLLAAFWPPR